MQFAALTPEIYCTDFAKTFRFYTADLGFDVMYQTREHKFAYLERQGAQMMIQELTESNEWISEKPMCPFGQGVNFRIYTNNVAELYKSLQNSGYKFVQTLEDQWYPKDTYFVGNRQFVLSDPDGYLLRFAQDLGTRTAQEMGHD